MTPNAIRGDGPDAGEPRITIDDVKQRAAAVRDLARSEARHAAKVAFQDKAAQAALVGVVAVVALASLAYWAGARRCAR